MIGDDLARWMGPELAPDGPSGWGPLSLRRASFAGHLGFPEVRFTSLVILSGCRFAQRAVGFDGHDSPTPRSEVGYILQKCFIEQH